MIEQERIDNLLISIKKLEAYHEIQNTMGRATAAFNFRQKENFLQFLALDQDDVSVEYADEGVFVGKRAVLSIEEQLFQQVQKPGEMIDMQLTTPMIEVADDLKTAKGLWWCPGAGAIQNKDGVPQAIWNWGQIAVDFIFNGQEWKIWHLHYFRLIKCDYKLGWVEDTSLEHRDNTAMNSESMPTTYHNPYTPTSVREGIPAMPMPYKTFTKDERYWELKRDKR